MTHPGDRVSQAHRRRRSTRRRRSPCSGLRRRRARARRADRRCCRSRRCLLDARAPRRHADRGAARDARWRFGPLYVGGRPRARSRSCAATRGADGPGFVVLALMFAWFGDTGAYFAGRFLGKHKLYEAVSPEEDGRGRDRRPRRQRRSARCSRTSGSCRRCRSSHGDRPRARRRRARSGGRSRRVAPQALDRREGLGRRSSPATAASSIASTRCS